MKEKEIKQKEDNKDRETEVSSKKQKKRGM